MDSTFAPHFFVLKPLYNDPPPATASKTDLGPQNELRHRINPPLNPPFCFLSTTKTQYKKTALTLHSLSMNFTLGKNSTILTVCCLRRTKGKK